MDLQFFQINSVMILDYSWNEISKDCEIAIYHLDSLDDCYLEIVDWWILNFRGYGWLLWLIWKRAKVNWIIVDRIVICRGGLIT
jgi:hypothetical protein